MTEQSAAFVTERHPDGFLVCPKCGGKLSTPKSSMIRGFHWVCGRAGYGCSGWASDPDNG